MKPALRCRLETRKALLPAGVYGCERYRLARHGMVDRSHIQVANRIGRIQREMPSPRNRDRQIIEAVIMAGNVGRIADPEAGPDGRRQQRAAMILGETGEIGIDGQRANIACLRAIIRVRRNAIKRCAHLAALTCEVKPVRPLAIGVTPAQLRIGNEIIDTATPVIAPQMIERRAISAALRQTHDRPVPAHAANHDRPALLNQRPQMLRLPDLRALYFLDLHRALQPRQPICVSRALRRRAIKAT